MPVHYTQGASLVLWHTLGTKQDQPSMQTFKSVFAEELKKLLREQIESAKNDLAYGASMTTFEAYREAVGVIRGLNNANDTVDEAEEKANDRERGL
jgi:hypothetical protein